MVFCSLIASSAIRAFISALKLRRCLDFISAPFPRQRFYTLLTGPNFGEHLTVRIPVAGGSGWGTSVSKATRFCVSCWWKQHKQRYGVTRTGGVATYI